MWPRVILLSGPGRRPPSSSPVKKTAIASIIATVSAYATNDSFLESSVVDTGLEDLALLLLDTSADPLKLEDLFTRFDE